MSVKTTASGDTLSRNDTTIGGTTSRSFSLWWRKTASSDNALFEINYGGGTWGTYISTFAGDAYIGDYSDVGSADYTLSPYVVNTWYHTAYTYDGTNVRVYLNGALVATAAWNSSGAPSGTNWNFGQSNAELQDICIYDAVLSADEIFRLYAERLPRRTANLLAYYPFWAGANRTLDYSGQGRTLTEAGTPTDGAGNPPAKYAGTQPRLIRVTATTVNLIGSGATRSAGSAAGSKAVPLVGAGANKSAGSATGSKAASLAATGTTRSAGAAARSSAHSLVGSGLTRAAGAAAGTKAAAISGSGETVAAGHAVIQSSAIAVGKARNSLAGRRGDGRRKIRW